MIAGTLCERGKYNKVEVAGVALFNGDKYTGTTLIKEKSGMLLLLINQLARTNRMALILGPKSNRQSLIIEATPVRESPFHF